MDIQKLKKAYREKVPVWLRRFMQRVREPSDMKLLKAKIVEYYDNENSNPEVEKIMKYLKKNPLTVFPYEFIHKYVYKENDIHLDVESGLKYVMHFGKRMYFKRSMDNVQINAYYNSICLEQDDDSPHCYMRSGTYKGFSARKVLDIGAAEGNFSLRMVDKAEDIYIFECDDEWLEALEYTFKGYNNVHIIKSYVSNFNAEDTNTVKLDDYFDEMMENIDMIKMDIEGEELNALKGARKIIDKNPQMQILACVYHSQSQEEELRAYFADFRIETSPGYIIFYYDSCLDEPYLRRGVLKISRWN